MPENTTPMTVVVTATLEVDTHGWTRDYGIAGEEAIRNDVNAFLSEALRSINENISVPQPFAITVEPVAPAPGHKGLDALLDAAAEAGYRDIALRPGESPVVANDDKSAGLVPGFTEPLDGEWLADQIRHLATSKQMPPNFFGTFHHNRHGSLYETFTDASMVRFLRLPAATAGHDQLDTLLDAAAEAGCSDIVLRPGEGPIFVAKGSGQLVPVPGFPAEPLNPAWLADQIRHLVTSLNLPPNFSGTLDYSRPGADFKAVADNSMIQFRRRPSASEPLTYTLTRNARHAGDKTWTDDTFTFSDGEVWEIVSETSMTPSGDFHMGPVTATKNGAGARPYEFHAKLATARAADEQPAPPLTYLVDRKESSEGNQHWDNALYTFSDGEIWEIVTEWTQERTGPTVRTVTEASIWVGGIPKEASHEDFLAKFATATPKIH